VAVPASERASPSALRTGLRCRCPRCGEGPLFAGFLNVAERCPACGLDLQRSPAGDGSAVLLIFLAGVVVVTLAIWLTIAYQPPLWVAMVAWPAVILAVALVLMRPLKAAMVALDYRRGLGAGETEAN
jgi:uncharacterized protein (DUF983 family)